MPVLAALAVDCRPQLEALGIETWPTDANFILAKAGADVYDALLQRGVIVRPMAGFGLTEHVRISIGLPEENERLIKALGELREGGDPREGGAGRERRAGAA